MNTSLARILVIVSLCSIVHVNTNGAIPLMGGLASAARSMCSWAHDNFSPAQNVGTVGSLWLAAKSLSPFGSFAAVGSGIALGWKARSILTDKKTIMRYAGIFGSGLAAGFILSRHPWIATDFIKSTAPAVVPLVLGCLLTSRAVSWVL